jgi:hypothetical protein
VTRFELLTLIITIIGIVLIPTAVMVIRLVVRWTIVESRLNEITRGVKYIVEEKDKAHHELYETMRQDRDATDRRLRWLEENLWDTRAPTSR